MDLSKFKEEDVLATSMFVLYKLREVPEYSLIGELPYILDKTNLENFCNYFGGRTITVPTLSEIKSIMYLIKIYDLINNDKMEFDEAFAALKYPQESYKKIRTMYVKTCEIFDKYKFGRE